MEDLKVEIDEKSFMLIQSEIIGNGAKWKGSGNKNICFVDEYKYLFFRCSKKVLEIGKRYHIFDEDKAKEVNVTEFIKSIKKKEKCNTNTKKQTAD